MGDSPVSQIPGSSALFCLLTVAATVFSLGFALRFLDCLVGWSRLVMFSVYGAMIVIVATLLTLAVSLRVPDLAYGSVITGIDATDVAGMVVSFCLSILVGPLVGFGAALAALPVDMLRHVASGGCVSYLVLCGLGLGFGAICRRRVPRHVLSVGFVASAMVCAVSVVSCLIAVPSVSVDVVVFEITAVALTTGLLLMGTLVFMRRELGSSVSSLRTGSSSASESATHRKALEKRVREYSRTLEEAESRYNALSDLCPDALLVHISGSIVSANAAAARILGYPDADSLIGVTFMTLVPDDLHDRASARTRLAMGGHPLPYVEERLLCRDGSIAYVEVGGRPVTFCGARAVMLMIRDISRRREAEAALKEGSDRWRLLFENMPDPIVILDLDIGRIEAVNASARIFFGDVFQNKTDAVDVSWSLASLLCAIACETEETRTCVTKVLPRATGMAGPSSLCITRFPYNGRRKALMLVRDSGVATKSLWSRQSPFKNVVLPERVCS